MGYSFTFKFSEKDIDFNPDIGNIHFDLNKFLINEFFNSSDSEMNIILREYQKVYGSSSYDYLLKNYYRDWRNGQRKISNVQFERIISIMPNLLNEKAKARLFEIREQIKYNHGKREFLTTIKKSVQSFESNQNERFYRTTYVNEAHELAEVFESEHNKIKSYSYNNSKKFGPTVLYLSANELNEALEISKYVLEVKLQNLYEQVARDFQIFLPFIESLKIGTFECYFKIKKFNILVNLAKFDSFQVRIPKFKIPEVEINNNFKKYSDKYLAYELAELQNIVNLKSAVSFLNNNDLNVFMSQYKELCKGENNIEIKGTFEGNSGMLTISIKFIPSRIIYGSIIVSLLKLLVYLVIAICLFVVAINNKAFLLLIIGGSIISIYIYSLITEELDELQTLIQHYKYYVRQ